MWYYSSYHVFQRREQPCFFHKPKFMQGREKGKKNSIVSFSSRFVGTRDTSSWVIWARTASLSYITWESQNRQIREYYTSLEGK